MAANSNNSNKELTLEDLIRQTAPVSKNVPTFNSINELLAEEDNAALKEAGLNPGFSNLMTSLRQIQPKETQVPAPETGATPPLPPPRPVAKVKATPLAESEEVVKGIPPGGTPKRKIAASTLHGLVENGLNKIPTPHLSLDIFKPLSLAMIEAESTDYADNVSPAGAKGLMQVMGPTAMGIAKEKGMTNFRPNDIFNPRTNVEFGTYYFNQQLKAFGGDIKLALAAYNWGPGNLRRLLNRIKGKTYEDIESHLPEETKIYVPRVLDNYKRLTKDSEQVPLW
jgi:hypothetical protein